MKGESGGAKVSGAAIDIPPMAGVYDTDDKAGIFDGIEDPVYPLVYAIFLLA